MSTNNLIKLSEAELIRFDELKAKVSAFVAPALKSQVTDFKSSQDAIDSRKMLKGFQKDLDRRVDELVAPHKAAIDLIKRLAKEIEDPIDRCDSHLKQQVDQQAAAQARMQAEMRKKEEERQRREEEEATEKRRKEEAAAEAKRKAELEALELARAKEPKTERRASFGRNLSSSAQAEASKKALDDKHELDRLEREARYEREKKIRESEAEGRQYDIRKSNISHTRTDYEVEVENIDLVPVELLKRELRISDAKKAYKAGGNKPIPGLKFTEKVGVALGDATHVPHQALEHERGFGRGPRE